MYLPIIEDFDKAKRIKSLEEFSEDVDGLSKLVEPFVEKYGLGEKEVPDTILNLRERNSKPKVKSESEKLNEHKSLLAQQIAKQENVIKKVKGLENGKEAFDLLYNADSIKDFYGFVPVFSMANDFVNSSIDTLTYESEFYTIKVERTYANDLPVIYFNIKEDKLSEVSDARKSLGYSLVYLTPSKGTGEVELSFYNTSLPSETALIEKSEKVGILKEFFKMKYLKKVPFWVKVLPNKYRKRWEEYNLRRLKYAYRLSESLKNDVRTYQRNTLVYLQTEDVLDKRKAIEDDLRNYVTAVNSQLGTDLKVVVKYKNT